MKLATFEKIDRVIPHPNADRLDLVTVLGFQCVVLKGILKVGEIIVFIQPDTCLPAINSGYIWADAYRKYVGSRVKAAQFRGEWSEGIVVPLHDVTEYVGCIHDDSMIGTEVSSDLGVTKFVAPEPEEEGAISSILPFFMKETNEDRFENATELPIGVVGDATLKIDGKSTTYYYYYPENRFGVCGRTIEFDPNFDNIYTRPANKLKEAFINFCQERKLSLALRGEIYGSGISEGGNNPHNKMEKSFACFNVFNISDRKYERKGSGLYYVDVCAQLGIETVPMIESNVIITREIIEKYSKGLKRIVLNGKEIKFEGIVFKHAGGSFKIINKHYDSEK